MTEPFRDFVTTRYVALVKYGVLLTGDHGHGEDLVQAALVKTYRAWERLHPDGDPESYTRRVMTRAAWRAGKRLWRQEVPVALVPDEDGIDPYDENDTARTVLSALRKLPAAQRVVLVLKYWGGLSERQIAAELGCSVGTVKSRDSRARAALRTGPLATALADVAPAPGPLGLADAGGAA